MNTIFFEQIPRAARQWEALRRCWRLAQIADPVPPQAAVRLRALALEGAFQRGKPWETMGKPWKNPGKGYEHLEEVGKNSWGKVRNEGQKIIATS